MVDKEAQKHLQDFDAEVHGDILSYFDAKYLPDLDGLETIYHNALRDILMSNCMRLRRGGAVYPQYRIDTQPFEGAYSQPSTGKYFRLSYSHFRFVFDLQRLLIREKATDATNAGSS